MKFSIVTISFNQAEFLERAIDSVVGQGGVDIEYIVVDPGSSDGSREIVDRYGDKIDHRIFESDRGPADGLNKGFGVATGDIYGYLNSDDTLEPGALAKVAAFFRANPKVDVVTGHCRVTGPNDEHLRRMWSQPFSRRRVAYGASVQVQPSTFIRKAAFDRTSGFALDNKLAWDAELLIDLYLSGAKIAIIDEVLSTYRLHSTSITNSGTLHAKTDLWYQHAFARLMNRPLGRWDRLVGRGVRFAQHFLSPRATIERVRLGPIYRRGV